MNIINNMEIFSKEDLFKNHNLRLTVGDLKEFIYKNNLSDDAILVVQRVEDKYYEQNGWRVYLKEAYNSNYMRQWNEDIESGKYLDKDEFPDLDENTLIPYTEEQIKNCMEQYTPAWCCVNYKEDKDILFIDLHY